MLWPIRLFLNKLPGQSHENFKLSINILGNWPNFILEVANDSDKHGCGVGYIQPIEVLEQETVDKDHGRFERRFYSVSCDVKNLNAKTNWPELKCIGRVRAIREENGKTSDETRYFISSRELEITGWLG